MISYSEAQRLLIQYGAEVFKGRKSHSVPLEKSVGRILAENLKCPEDVPSFTNSAMDGFVLRASDTHEATAAHSIVVRKLGMIAAGDRPVTETLYASDTPNSEPVCFEIMTGAPIPKPISSKTLFDAVVKVEDVTRKKDSQGEWIEITKSLRSGENIRGQAEDFKKGTPLVNAPLPLMAEHVLAFASLGVSEVKVLEPMHIALIPTGRELVPLQTPHLEPGQIRNSTAPYIQLALNKMTTGGAQIREFPIVRDEAFVFRKHLETLLSQKNHHLVITTGAVSMGQFDFVRSVLEEMGAEILFHKVAIRPGKPILFARFPGPNPLYLVGLPGNPISSAVGLKFFVEPFLRAAAGLPLEKPLIAIATQESRKPEGLRCFFKAHYEITPSQTRVEILGGQASFMVSSLLRANSWAVLPEEGERITQGQSLEVYSL